ncbi:DUF5710 domain-containing protein [Burkholderia sp. Ac-20353]|uniref:DUF5710 domain-containing protein n=1 Tax=Burkholderia sp. Ac-20353 TaxID=2703894 RepID=UPI00197BD4DE|nr:DUF5710 domain-containing protein [Burkholderia sp. Ac-20353]MBN3786095.1 hypothetical protein [Burkholderia sp. Ac-20353]
MADENKPKRERTYLDVPFKEKDAAHEMGAKFDRRTKKWYVPGGADVAPFARWMPTQDPQKAQSTPDAARAAEPETLLGSEADVEREAVRLSEMLAQPVEAARELVRETVRAAEERAALDARDRFRDQGGSAFDAIDGVHAAVRQARHQYFAERQHLYSQSVQPPQTSSVGARRGAARQAPVRRARPKLDDAALGRRYREMIQSIATAVTLRGDEVTRTLALEHRLESIHRDAWRKSGDAADGDRAIGAQIRTRTGFAAEELPPQAAEALSKLRDAAELSPMEVDERTPARDVTDSDPPDDERSVDQPGVEPQHPHRHPEPGRDDGIATFADVAEAFMLEEAMRERAPSGNMDVPAAGVQAQTPPSQPDGEIATFADVGDAAAIDNAPGERTPSPSAEQSGPAAPERNTATFADVADASVIDDAMRRRGLTGDAVTGTQDAARSTVSAAVANEPDVQPGQAANDVSMNVAAQPGAVDTQIKRTQAPAQNEPDAKNAANETTRPELDTVSTQDLQRVRTVRAGERAAAETLLREQRKPMPKVEAASVGAPAETVGVDANDNQIGVDPASRKPIVKKDGYEVPAQVASRYMVKEGRFWKLDGMDAKPGAMPTTKPHFEDVGSRLTSQQNDRATIADMVAVAQAKHWDAILVRGSETFRRNAWIEASLAGVDVKGFKPTESDEALLEAAKRERAALTIKAGKSPEPTVGQQPEPMTTRRAAVDENKKPAVTSDAMPSARTEAKPEPKPVASAAAADSSQTVAQLREILETSLEREPARMRTEVMRRFDARMQAGTEVEARIARGELSRDAGSAEIDKRAAELHAAWTAPKAAPTSSPSNNPHTEQQPSRGPMPNAM